MEETHILPLAPACPYSGNPKEGSKIRIKYEPKNKILEVASLRAYVDSYTGGKGDIRSMEGMIQAITRDCANAVGVACYVRAELVIEPNQEMILECSEYAASSLSSGGGGAEPLETCPASKGHNDLSSATRKGVAR